MFFRNKKKLRGCSLCWRYHFEHIMAMLRLEGIFSSIVDVLEVFSLLVVSILQLKWDLMMTHKWLVLRRIWLFNAAEGIRCYIARGYLLLIYCYAGHSLLNRSLCAFHMHLLIGHRDHKIYSSWNGAVSTTTASWHLTCHFSNDVGNFPAHIFIVK